MNSVLQNEPGNGSDNYRQANQNANNLQNEPPNPIGKIQSKKPHNNEKYHRGVRQGATFDLVENARNGLIACDCSGEAY
jgi:hypothetical protein